MYCKQLSQLLWLDKPKISFSWFSRLKSRIMPSLSDIKYDNEKVERLIDFQKSRKRYSSFKDMLETKINERILVQYKGRMIPFWHTMQFKEALFLHFPRILFLIFTWYIITQIRISNEKKNSHRKYSKSYRQEGKKISYFR